MSCAVTASADRSRGMTPEQAHVCDPRQQRPDTKTHGAGGARHWRRRDRCRGLRRPVDPEQGTGRCGEVARIRSWAACLTGAVWLGPGPTQAVSPCHGRGHDELPGSLTAEAKAVSGLRPGTRRLIPRGMLRGVARAGECWEAPERRRLGKRPEARPWVHGCVGDTAWCSVGVL